jgi:hypothetical protein
MSQEDARPVTSEAGNKDHMAAIWSPAYGLRRRRRASWRMAPMACGHRDPLDCDTHTQSAPYHGDYWHTVGAHLTMAELAGVGA